MAGKDTYQGQVFLFNTATNTVSLETFTVIDHDHYFGDGFNSDIPAHATVTTPFRDVPVSLGNNSGFTIIYHYETISGIDNNAFGGGLQVGVDSYVLFGPSFHGFAFDDLASIEFIDAVAYDEPGTLPARNTYMTYGLIDITPDTISGDGGNNTLKGDAQDSIVRGKGGNDTLSGQGGKDTLFGDNGDDVLKGNSGRDLLAGGKGQDHLYGGKEKDVLKGAPGNDTLTGGAGGDRFIFRDGGGKDTITDFQDDIDTIKLDTALWGGGLDKQQVVTQFAHVVGGDIVFDFGTDGVTLQGFTNLSELKDDIIFI